MMMKIELSNDAVDNIFRSVMIQDYKMLKEDIKRLKDQKPNLKEYQKEDLKANKRYKKAMEVLLEYYVGMDWKEATEDETSADIPDEY
jgi:stress response protein YsnF